MFHPLAQPMERGWVGRLDGEHVVQLAAQTLQSFFTGGGSAREHAVYPLDGVRLLAPVLHPPSIRIYDGTSFGFANPAAVVGPGAEIVGGDLLLLPRLAALVGAGGALAGFTGFAEWRRPGLDPPKDRDFAFGLGPVVVVPDGLPPTPGAAVRVNGIERARAELDGWDWPAARDRAAAGTTLVPGDLLVSPALAEVEVEPGSSVELEAAGIGVLGQRVLRD